MSDFKNMSVDELRARLEEIPDALNAEGADVDALDNEVRSIKEELERRAAEESKKKEIREMLAAGKAPEAEVIEKQEERKMPDNMEIRNSKEYIDAYAEYLKNGDDAECRGLLTENATNGTVPVPELVYDIVKTAWDREGITRRVRKAYVKGNLKVGFEISCISIGYSR